MTTRSWLRTLFAHPVTRLIRKAPARCRPAIEALEDRTAPSTVTPTKFDDGAPTTPGTLPE